MSYMELRITRGGRGPSTVKRLRLGRDEPHEMRAQQESRRPGVKNVAVVQVTEMLLGNYRMGVRYHDGTKLFLDDM